MKIHCSDFFPKSGCFYQMSVKVCPKQLPFLSFQGNFYDFDFSLKFLLFRSRSPPLFFISGFSLEKSEKLHYILKK